MPKLAMDPISAKTLPALDKFYLADDPKLTSIIASTKGEPLKRLLMASIARQTMLGYPNDPRLTTEARLLEILIHNNLISNRYDNNLEEIAEVLDVAGEAAQQMMLTISIIRYNRLSMES